MTRRERLRGLRRGACLLPFLSGIAGCAGVLAPGDGPEAEIRRQREVWERTRPPSYSFELERLCFCVQEARGPVRIEVQGLRITGRRYVAGGDPVSDELAPGFPSIDGLFDLLEEAAADGAHELRVDWDADRGFPRDLWIDFDPRIADEEVGYRIGRLDGG